ncbi:hypothetical protein [Ralstonia insidiosa]|jgi:hypothetical protein|uniref:Uncharacterized protein n=1 Tax=Ralstonia insidiosa TaxID=190721 RepID=A0A848P3P7_9RALS|nr:hypothetical protein [Ralstonia insidiosa]NMV39945.1 hypothetical protein [Ralstonia insidiosa]
MRENESEGPAYEFEASYVYASGERYNSGRGLSVISRDLAEQEALYERMKSDRERYALRLRRLDTGEVVRAHGDMAEAHRSMEAAYRLRHRPQVA